MDRSLRDVFDRYGAAMALIATIALLVALLPSNAKGSRSVATNGGPTAPGPAGEQNAGLQQEAAANNGPGGTGSASPSGGSVQAASGGGGSAAASGAKAAGAVGAAGTAAGPS